ncbi:MAG TPA: hypothetical protein VEI97_03995, partial [bacterium]|nr:hypothetical protein [bacterium]
MRSPLALVLTLALLGSLPGVAQANSTYRSDAMKGPGETLEVVEVPEGMGDGAITERDLLALSEFFTFTYDEVGEFLGLNEMFEVELGDDAEDRMLGFWLYIWPSVDQTTKAQVSTFDKFWPAFRK